MLEQNLDSDSSNNFRQDSSSYTITQVKHQRFTLKWSEVFYTVKTKSKTSTILQGVSGFANPGELLAIMGSSGSGKTSLLSLLSNQIIPDSSVSVSGSIQINGKNIKSIDYSAYARYVMQQDILLPTLTPRETLMFAARMKVAGTNAFIKEKVEKILNDLKLVKVADNMNGNEIIKGISGGEKKRVCIGVELISEPSLLILDEPTSGLDSFTADLVLKLLKNQAEKGKTIITTIHQPSTTIFQLFDRLILMANGHFIYQGKARDSQHYFEQLNYNCPDLTNPPDYYMRILYVHHREKPTEEEKNRIDLFVSAYKGIEAEVLSQIDDSNLTLVSNSFRSFHPGFLIELRELLVRSFKNSLRNPLLFFVKIAQGIVLGFITDVLFRDLGYGYVEVQAREGVLFFSTINLVMMGSGSTSMTFPSEKALFLKDYKENLYGVTPYFLSKLVAELPTQIIFTLLYVLIIYFAVDLNRQAAQFFVFFGIALLIHLVGAGYGNVAGAISRDSMAAAVYGPLFSASFIMFGGFFSNTNSMTKAFYWIKYISAFNFGYEGFCINEFTDLPYDKTTFPPGETPLEQLGFTSQIWQDAGGLLLIELGTILIVLIVLKISANSYKAK